jgi:hypothetical protein
MTYDEIALANLGVAKLQLWVIALSILLGFLIGVIFTFWYQYRSVRIAEKHKLFIALMSERGEVAVSPELAKSLNTIDVVFSDNASVIEQWHKYYPLLTKSHEHQKNHLWQELLKAMAVDLHYSNLKQTDLDKFYISQGCSDDAEFHRKATIQCLSNLENTERSLLDELSINKVLSE